MPEFNLKESIITSLNAQEPWPNDVKLFQPYEVEQILLPDNASCLAVQAFLKMCNLPFEVEMRWNAEFMSPSGRVPFIKCGAFVVSELEPIVQFAANKGVSLCGRLSTEEKAEMRAYMSLITNVLVNAELYISWLDDDTFNAVTKVRNSSVYPWPLGWLQTRSKRNAVAKRLKALHWHDKTLEQVLADVEQCCNSLSQRLGDRDFFFGTPSPVDALVYGHMRALLSANGPKAALMIKPISSALLRHVLRMKNLTNMELTPQEDYLITQAVQISRRRLSPTRTVSERSTRIKRSKMCIKKQSKENTHRDVFGFKPFASKQIIIMTSNEGGITCKYEAKIYDHTDSRYNFIVDMIDDLLDKVEEISIDDTFTIYNDKGDFEVIDSIKDDESSFTADRKDFLHTIEEDCADNTSMESESLLSNGEDVIQIINDEDSEGLVNEKMSTPASNEVDVPITPETVDSSANKKETQRTFVSVSSSGDQLCAAKSTFVTVSSSGDELSRLDSLKSSASQSTMKLPSDEEMSVQSLLNCLRQKNTYGYHVDADVD